MNTNGEPNGSSEPTERKVRSPKKLEDDQEVESNISGGRILGADRCTGTPTVDRVAVSNHYVEE